MEFENLEQAMEHIVELNDRIHQLEDDLENRNQTIGNLQNESQSLREINQRYYNRLIAQETETEPAEEEEQTESLEDFARKLKI